MRRAPLNGPPFLPVLGYFAVTSHVDSSLETNANERDAYLI